MSKATIKPTKISQLYQGQKIKNTKGDYVKSPSICRDGNADPSYHPWESSNLENFLSGKQIQCGRKSTYHCSLKTVRWIKGYRNTCPIAGCCGTFNKPAPLVLNKFNFKDKKIIKKIKITEINISYKHHLTGVDVGVGKGSETKSWGGYFPYVDIILYKNNTQISTIRHNKKVPLAKNATVKASFNKVINEFNPLSDDLKIEIHYSSNGGGQYSTTATQPSIIYATDLNINIEYKYLEQPKITPAPTPATISSNDKQATIITDPRLANTNAGNNNCRTTFSHTISYQHAAASDIIVTVPRGVKYTTEITNNRVKYTYQDTSGVPGEKTITYTLKSNKQQKIVKTYIAKLYTRPAITVATNYIKNQQYKTQDTFISISNKCWNNIKIYVDGNQKLLANWNNTTPNVAMPNSINHEAWLNNINVLSCGNHILNIYIDGIFYQDVQIQIKPPQITFEANIQGIYLQDKSNPYIPIEITRTDSNALTQAVNITIIDTAETQKPPETISLEPHETKQQYINIYKPGIFQLQYTYNDGCKNITKTFGEYTVVPTHTQSYDNLLIRSETPIEYESIVVRAGDNQRQPITYTDANLKQSMNDIILFGKDGRCALGDLGYGILAVKNNSQNNIYNLCIELNPLITSDDTYEEFNPLIMEWKTGMLQNFDKNFSILNPQLETVIDILNTKHYDFINEGTENVILCIKEIKPGDDNVLEIKIPYSSAYAQEIYMNFLLLGEPTDFIDLDNDVNFEDNYSFYQQDSYDIELFASHTQKQEERHCMCISLKTIDMLSAELYIDGDDLDRNDIINSDDLDIRYRIQLSSLDCDKYLSSDINIQTEIKNDIELIPTGYKIGNGDRKDFDMTIVYDENNNIKKRMTDNNPDGINVLWGLQDDIMTDMIGEEVFLRYLDINNQPQYLRATTDKDGFAIFKYLIPDYQQDNSDISLDTEQEYHLKDILKHVDIFYRENDFYEQAILDNQSIHHNIHNTEIQIWGFIYYSLNQQPTFVDINNLQDINITNIYNIYIVGRLIDTDAQQGINDEIISCSIKYGANNIMQQQGVTQINTSDLYGQDRQNLDGFFKIKINKRQSNQQTSYNLRQIYNNRYLSYRGDLWRQESENGYRQNTIAVDKKQPILKYINDYNIYRKGEVINIKVHLAAPQERFINTITINHQLVDCGQSIHIFYQPCTTENTKGFKTVFKTKSDNIIPNQVEELIYCGVKTDLKILAKLQKKIVENHNVNVLTINAINGYKPNKNVLVKALIGADNAKQRLGDYLALSAIDIDKEKYSYDRSSDIIYWKIGDMNSYETQICNILLEGENIGHNTIYVCGFDYLNPDVEKVIPTELTLLGDDNVEHYVDDTVLVKAKLIAPDTQQNLYGQIYFDIQYHQDYQQEQNLLEYQQALTCVLNHDNEAFNNDYQSRIEELLNKTDIFNTTLTQDDVLLLQHEITETNNIIQSLIQTTKAQAQITTNNNEYFALAHIKLKNTSVTTIQASYEGAQMLSLHYEPSISNTLVYDNIIKYDTVLKLRCDQQNIKTKENIQIIGSVLYNEQTKQYFDTNLDIKFIVNNQELHNIDYIDNQYIVNFAVTQPGEYVIQAFIPETNKTQESLDKITINVIDGENND